jgi:hypothetical protein
MFLPQNSKFQIQKSKNVVETLIVIDLYNFYFCNNRTLVELNNISSFKEIFIDQFKFAVNTYF